MSLEKEIEALFRIGKFHQEDQVPTLLTFYTWNPNDPACPTAEDGFEVALSLPAAKHWSGERRFYQGEVRPEAFYFGDVHDDVGWLELDENEKIPLTRVE